MPELFSTTNTTQPGYFRIGFVVLQIPPTDISTNRVVNDEQVSTLRSRTPMFVKTGQARWDVTARWKAVRFENTDGTYDYSQWQDLQNIAAMFKVAPFVEVENDYLRQHFAVIQPSYKSQRMAFALKQLRIDTNPDSNNVIDVTLTMSLFNYSPYSTDFSYVGGTGDAKDSTAFQDFISSWIASNVSNPPVSHSTPPTRSWNLQDEGVITFKWREYIYIPIDSPPAPVAANVAVTSSSTGPSRNTSKRLSGKLSNDIQTIVNSAATKYGLDPSIVTAQCLYESGGNPNAGRGRTDHGGLGLFQLVASTASQLGVSDVWDPNQNADGACRYLAQQLAKFGNYPHALGAYNVGAAYIYAYRDGVTQDHGKINPQKTKTSNGLPPSGIPHGEDASKYVNTILTTAQKTNLITQVPPKSTTSKPPVTPTTVVLGDSPTPEFVQLVNTAVLQYLPPGQWILDHYTEQGIFFFKEHEFTLASSDSPTESDFNMFPSQISVVLINNLPTIPLAALQYPTYQHVGPCDTLISVNFHSVGNTSDLLAEPEHGGIQALTHMSSSLEEQFKNMRTLFRATSSIHRMQAVYVENQILNMLGIRGTMIRGVNTETVPDAADLAEVGVLISQYENIFEDINPFTMNGIPKAYNSTLKSILTGGQLNKLSSQEQATVTELTNFSSSWASKDPAFLLQELLTLNGPATKLNVMRSFINTPDAGLTSAQKDTLLNSLDLQSTSAGAVAGASSVNPILGAITSAALPNQYQRDLYPGLQQRRLDLQGTGTSMTYADYFVFSQLPVTNNQLIGPIKTATDSKFTTQKSSIIDTMYSSLFDLEVLTNPLFSRQAALVTNSPAFKSQFTNAVTVYGPATQKDSSGNLINPGHCCYADLGLTDYKQDPAGYFTDWNQVINTDASNEVTKVFGTANQTANTVNTPNSVISTGATSPVNNGNGFTFSGNGQGLPGAANGLIRQMNIPAYSMNSAFPTFKLLLLEEDNTGPFFAFDNFYSYASVSDIEIIKYRDKPDQAVIQITNLAHMLQHRLYDDTALGKLEKQADKFNVDPNSGLIINSDGTVAAGTGGNPSAGLTASKTAGGLPYQLFPRKNMTEGRNEAWTRVPLKFFALQTGSKIQVRLGFSNNPDDLFPVFTGIVTSIEGDDMLILTCQSFMLELMNIPGTLVAKNSLWGFNFASGGAAFGGYSLTSSGDTLNIMKTMISAPTATHFGHWQIGSQNDPLIKGFSWSAVAGTIVSASNNQTLQQVGGLLQTGYDRSGENILVNSVNNFDASKTAINIVNSGSRTWDNENPNWFLGSAKYSIPKQSTLSVWDILKDMARRYPQYNLMVKDYGYPYGADATLVYAHPLDWYYYRPALLGDNEKEPADDLTQASLFVTWWSTVGEASWNHIFDTALPGFLASVSVNLIKDIQTANNAALTSELSYIRSTMTTLAGSGPEGFNDATQFIHQILTGTLTPQESKSLIGASSVALFNVITNLLNYGNVGGNQIGAIDANFQALYREWEAYLQNNDPAANSGRIKPVRKYHLIDHNHIIHNGITVNDNIYNTVKISDETPLKFNQNITDNHVRCLDVTELINDPDQNVLQGAPHKPLLNAYAQSFLREEVGKMYQGELIIRGVPEIEPFDVVLLNDMSTGMIGPVEVETVIHSFNQQDGYITIIRPRCLVIVNESVSLSAIQTLGFAWSNAMASINNLKEIFNPSNPNVTKSAIAIDALFGSVAVITAAAAFAWAPPIGITLAALGLLATAGILMFTASQNTNNFFMLMPLSRFGRPWIGGLQGFAISDFAYSIGQSFKFFDAEEIAPTIESWNELMNFRGDYLIQRPDGQ